MHYHCDLHIDVLKLELTVMNAPRVFLFLHGFDVAIVRIVSIRDSYRCLNLMND